MPNPSDTVQVTIFNTPYSLSPPADPQTSDIREVAEYLDAKMLDISERASLVSSTKVAVLAALEIAHELFELRRTTEADANNANRRIAELVRTIDNDL